VPCIKETIKNRKGLNLVVEIEQKENQQGLVFIVHGFGRTKDEPEIKTIRHAFLNNNYTAASFDATNSSGEGGGKLENATITNHYQDLKDIITWAENKEWYQQPFCLAGNSMGSFCAAWFAINHPKKVKSLILTSSFVSGKLFSQIDEISPILKSWKDTGMREWESSSRPGLIKRLKYNFMEDAFRYDLTKRAEEIKVSVLIIAGDKDETTPLEHQKLLFNALDTEKELHIIKGTGHTFKRKAELGQLEKIMGGWLKKIN